MKLSLIASDTYMRDGKTFFAVQYKSLHTKEEYQRILNGLKGEEIEVLLEEQSTEESFERTIEELPDLPKPPVKEKKKQWSP